VLVEPWDQEEEEEEKEEEEGEVDELHESNVPTGEDEDGDVVMRGDEDTRHDANQGDDVIMREDEVQATSAETTREEGVMRQDEEGEFMHEDHHIEA
ncbi:hypothetical protein H0H92_015406, partial [Tricholoma furcatifolium]